MKLPTLTAAILAAILLVPAGPETVSAQTRVETQSVVCQSENRSRAECRVRGRIQTVQPVESYSFNPCIFGYSWGYENRKIWVDQGCHAKFDVTVERGQAQPAPQPAPEPAPTSVTESLICESFGRQRSECQASGTIIKAEPTNVFSRRRCREGRSYGYEGSTLWVDRGCHAQFSVEVALNAPQPEPQPQPQPSDPQPTPSGALDAQTKALMAQNACMALWGDAGRRSEFIFAVERQCSTGALDCNKVCANASQAHLQTPFLKNRNFASKACYNAVHIYDEGASPVGAFGPASYIYNSCTDTHCGPNYCCCSAQ